MRLLQLYVPILARKTHKLLIGGGDVIRAKLSFSGRFGVLRFDDAVANDLDAIMTEELEHH